ncbi:unnamed protein product [Staurois parvus]|uniref:Uncharacterized protein n=1 Tax=Staurois parvus TaxID=386267 RepID=A0ABN9H2H6_9NEOB|nr:unnamed protein product [Staurois parvus]
MDTDRWRCWDYTDHQGILISTHGERNADNWHFPVYM